MSDVVHFTDDKRDLPKRFLCGRCKQSTYTRMVHLVDCPQCRAKLRERGAIAAVGRGRHGST